ncbi:hypothetical protein [Hydrogenoanaerobacterium sp.]|uniref:hypothetical protein n=1 Tax=Hydrogenoanaerobacterium sp. TaxID=2953763 RepID=UPI002899763E|nr:hypothetical protein [Hydrogenoanaerobacterium sp.]
MKIILKDKTELPIIMVNGAKPFCKGSVREGLEFVFRSSEVNYDNLRTLLRNETNTEEITIVTDNKEQFTHSDYSIDAGFLEKPVVVEPSTPDTPEQTEYRIFATLGQFTYLEKQMKKIGIQV